MSTDTAKAPTISTILAAMDAVDMARNNEAILNDEANLEERKAILRDKLKATYAEQNITVSEQIIEQGVNEFFEQRYSFKPMEQSFSKWIANIYIKRERIGRFIFSGTIILLCIISAYLAANYGAKEFKAYSAKQEQIAKQKVLEQEARDKKLAEQRQKAALLAEQQRTKELQNFIAAYPNKILAVFEAIKEVAKEQRVKDKAELLYNEGMGYIKAKEIDRSSNSYNEIIDLLNRVAQEYTLVINQSGKTGFWRTPNSNPSSKRYYIVVNAQKGNTAVPVNIKNEEDGFIKHTAQWAEQVTQREFESIRNEKQSSGVLKHPIFAVKEKGYLDPVYQQGLKVSDSNNADGYRLTKW